MDFFNLINDVKSKAMDKYKEPIEAIKGIWSAQEVNELLNGQMMLPYALVNEHLEKNPIDPDITHIVLSSAGESLIRIEMEHKKYGKIECLGEIQAFFHNSNESVLKFHIVENKIVGKSFLSQIIVNIGYFIFSKVLGKAPASLEKIGVQLKNDIVTVDFKPFLLQSTWGQKKVMNKALVDVVSIERVDVSKTGFLIHTNLDAAAEMKKVLGLFA